MNNHDSNSSDTLDLSDIMCKYYDNANNFSNDCNNMYVLILFVFIYLMHLCTRASLSHSKTAGNQNVSQSHDSRLTSNVIKDKC